MACLSHGFILFAWLQHSRAAPSRNLTALNTQYAPPFVSTPDGRGTWDLLYSSILTLILCVYTALHPNLPAPTASRWTTLRLRARSVTLAIFAPEINILIAFKQYRRANMLTSQLQKLNQEHNEMGSDIVSGNGRASDGESTVAGSSKEVEIHVHHPARPSS